VISDEKKGFNLNVNNGQLIKLMQKKDFFTFQDKTGLVVKLEFKFSEEFKKVISKMNDYLM
jgi:hypothetical protein